MKILFSALLLLLLVSPLLAQNDRSKNAQGERKFPKRVHDGPLPHIRKCLDVKCKRGTECFHGRCIDKDDSCAAVLCLEGSRCVKGKCIPRRHKPQKAICAPLGFKQQKVQCDNDLHELCKRAKIIKDVCGYNPRTKEYHDFLSPCEACQDRLCGIKFFYEVPCNLAPRICGEQEECLNGVCTDMFTDPIFSNRESCNKNSDCQPQEQCAGHKCIDKRDLYNYLESMSEVTNIRLRVV